MSDTGWVEVGDNTQRRKVEGGYLYRTYTVSERLVQSAGILGFFLGDPDIYSRDVTYTQPTFVPEVKS